MNVPARAEERDEAEAPRRRVPAGLWWRLAAAVVIVVETSAYATVVDRLPDLPLWWDVALAGFVLIPATMLLAWLALPLWRWHGVGAAGAALTALALLFALAELDVPGNVTKALAVILLALAFLKAFERPWWIALVALAIPLVDAVSVWRGPTRHIVTEEPGVFGLLSIAFPVPNGSFQLGLPDLLFFTLFLAAASRWEMRVGLSWLLMTASFGATMALALWLDPFGLGGLPALPALSIAFLLANGDHLLRSFRPVPAPAEPVRHLRVVPDPEPGAEPEPASPPTVGVAEADDGWVVVGVEDGQLAWWERRPAFAEALELGRDAEVIAVDAPLAESRLAARADRLYLGPPARRIYIDFLRELAAAGDDAEAETICADLGWDGLTRESLAFRRRAREVEAHRGDPRLVEVDAARVLAELAAGAATASPRELLARIGIEAPTEAVRAAAVAAGALRGVEGASESPAPR